MRFKLREVPGSGKLPPRFVGVVNCVSSCLYTNIREAEAQCVVVGEDVIGWAGVAPTLLISFTS
jgi:hypothetical protein